LPTQLAQALPLTPHIVSPVPVWHCVPSQQPPLQMRPPVQLAEQLPPLQAWPTGQSLAEAQPHICETQAWPDVELAAVQSVHMATLLPHAPLAVPGAQVVPLQQPPLQLCDAEQVVVQPCAVVSQAVCAGQSPVTEQPHLPPPVTATHTWPAELEVQLAQVAPLPPHTVLLVPVWQVVPSQQPPLQMRPPAHELVHWCELLQAVPAGQSVEALQPQVSVPDWHTWPVETVEQSTQAESEAPQAELSVPAAHIPFEPQHEPLHGAEAEQAVEQVCAVASQALPDGQSAWVVQPQALPPLVASHTEPMLELAQLTQAPPVEPQPPMAVPGTQLPARQQPPWQILVDEQLDEHRCVLVSQALPPGQSLEVRQPHALEMQVCPLELVVQSTHDAPQQVACWLLRSGGDIVMSWFMAMSGVAPISGPVPFIQQCSSEAQK
jgi:hypothetical protein